MENASKALLIAGAILLAILLISLGIWVLNQGKDVASNSGISQISKTAFNQKFTQYEGNQKGSAVRSLVQEVIAANSDENNKDAGISITVYYNSTAITSTASIKNTQTYSIGVFYGANGYVDQIRILDGANKTVTRK